MYDVFWFWQFLHSCCRIMGLCSLKKFYFLTCLITQARFNQTSLNLYETLWVIKVKCLSIFKDLSLYSSRVMGLCSWKKNTILHKNLTLSKSHEIVMQWKDRSNWTLFWFWWFSRFLFQRYKAILEVYLYFSGHRFTQSTCWHTTTENVYGADIRTI